MIGGDAVHVFRLHGDAAEEVAAAADDRDLAAELVDFFDLVRDLADAHRIDAETLLPCERLAGELQQDAFVFKLYHSFPRSCTKKPEHLAPALIILPRLRPLAPSAWRWRWSRPDRRP